MATPKFCKHCGAAIAPDSHFCANCGARVDGAAGPAPRGTLGSTTALPWFILASLLMAGLGYAIGSRGLPPAGPLASVGPIAQGDGIIAAPDISSLSPEERVDRLFNRVMTLAAAGKQDSVQFFAPMAINALAALMPLDTHRRYDLGLIQLTAGDPVGARAQADTILAAHPTHLLGLALAMRVATAENRPADAARLSALLSRSAASERAKRLPEYADHAPDIAEALEEAARRAGRTAPPR
jgi:hypothetical protein